MKRRYLSILLVMTMIFFVTGGFAVPAKGALLPYTATLTITPSQSEIDVTTGSVDVIYTLKVTPPAGQHIGVFSFDLKAPAGMTLSETKTSTKGGDGYWVNTSSLYYHEDLNPTGIFETFKYTPVPNGSFIASGTQLATEITQERNMTIEADIMTIKATITDASKAGSYALAAENPNVGPDGTDTFTFAITSTPVVVANPAAVPVTGVTLDQDTMTLTAGGATGTLTATVAPENATNKNVSWTSSDESVATVANGVVTPVAAGLATITVTTADGNKTATCDVTVTTAGTYTVTLSGGGTGATGSGSYTAGETVNIAAGDRSGYTFKGWTSDDVTITNDSNKNTSFTMPAKNVTVTATWKKTNSGGGGGGAVAPTVAGVEIKSAPDKLVYTEGDALDLTGLQVTLTYSNGNKKYAALNEFDENDITVSPKDGDVLDAADTEIVITVNGKSVKQAITVNKKETVTPPPVEKPVLNDIDGHWAQANIEYLVGIGAVAGYPDETFRPDALITRAEFAKVIVDAFELTAESGKVFTDTADHWAEDYIATAAANGIVTGYSDTEFGPDDLITREQMAVMIVKAAKLSIVTGELNFIDKANISDWASSYVITAVQNELMNGYQDNSFKPLNNATRAEAATVIYNALMK